MFKGMTQNKPHTFAKKKKFIVWLNVIGAGEASSLCLCGVRVSHHY